MTKSEYNTMGSDWLVPLGVQSYTYLVTEYLHLSLGPGDEGSHHKLVHEDAQAVLVRRRQAAAVAVRLPLGRHRDVHLVA